MIRLSSIGDTDSRGIWSHEYQVTDGLDCEVMKAAGRWENAW